MNANLDLHIDTIGIEMAQQIQLAILLLKKVIAVHIFSFEFTTWFGIFEALLHMCIEITILGFPENCYINLVHVVWDFRPWDAITKVCYFVKMLRKCQTMW